VTWTPGKTPLVTFRPEGEVTDWIPSLREFRESGIADEIAKTQDTLNAAFLVVTQLGGQRMDSSGGNQASAGAGDGRKCDHGVMKYSEGISQKTRKPWKRYDCPTKAANCAAQWG
jgi:hypothetical protein